MKSNLLHPYPLLTGLVCVPVLFAFVANALLDQGEIRRAAPAVATVAGRAAAAPAPAPVPAARGAIEGTVTDADSGQPLTTPGVVALHRANGDLVATTAPAADGSYVFTRLPQGIYYARATFDRYPSRLYGDRPCDDGCDVTTGVPIVATGRTRTVQVDFALPPRPRNW